MTDFTAPQANVQAAEEWDLPAVPLEQVKDLFVTLQKALRAFQLYDENNPVYQRFVTNLKEAFEGLWAEVDHLRVQIEEDQILLLGVPVYLNQTRSESLAFLFFKDGVRDIQFLAGIEGEELERFLRVLQRARNLTPEGEDLLTILWDEDLQFFRYVYVDLLAEGVEIPEPDDTPQDLKHVWVGELSGAEDLTPSLGPATLEQEAEEPPPAKIPNEDFNPTLYSLDPREADRIRDEVRSEMDRDLRGDVLAALFDRIEEPGRPERGTEILGIFRMLLPNLMTMGEIGYAAMVLEELNALVGMDVLGADQRSEVDAILDDISGSGVIGELVHSLEVGAVKTTPEALAHFFTHLRGTALRTLLDHAERVEDKRLQSVLLDAVRGIAAKNPGAVVALLAGDDPAVVAGACRLAGRMGLTEAGPALGKLLGHASSSVRLAAIEASVELKASTAASALQTALSDSEREVRIAAARGLGALRYGPASTTLKHLVVSKAIRQADISEQIAVFESYGALGGADAVELLGKLLNKRGGLLGRGEPPEIRACAALGLGQSALPAAVKVLQAADDVEPVVKSAVGRALRRGQE